MSDMDENYFKKIATAVIIIGLTIFSFFLLKPFLISIITGLILAFILYPSYLWVYKVLKVKSGTLPAWIMCIALCLVVILPLWFFTPTIIDESIKFYRSSQELDLVTPLKNLFPNIFASQEFSQEAGTIIQTFITKITSSLMVSLSNIILELPAILLQIFVILFTFYYTLKEKDGLVKTITEFLPFSKDVEKKLVQSTKEITFSILYGQVVLGGIQGIILGVGLFSLGAPNPFLLSLLAVIVGVFPLVGPSLVGIPVAFYFFSQGNAVSAIGILGFTMLSSFSEQLFRPILVSKRTKLHPSLIMFGMIGGYALIGILGLILGPLILAYFLTIIEVYRNKDLSGVLIKPEA